MMATFSSGASTHTRRRHTQHAGTTESAGRAGEPVGEPEVVGAVREPPPDEISPEVSDETTETLLRKFYVDHGSVEIAARLVYELDADGKQLRVVRFTDYTAEKARGMCPSAVALSSKWSSAEERATILEALEEQGISLKELMAAAKQPDADPFDLLCHAVHPLALARSDFGVR